MADSTSGNGYNGDYELATADNSIGEPIQVIKVTADRKFELDVEALSSILLRDHIRDTPVVVVSIAGDSRKGKSFLLNFFLRYLQSGCGAVDWLGDDNTPLKGFSWRGGFKRDTTGIVVWSEPFIVAQEDGKQVAIILMDTQGWFVDSQFNVMDWANVFAISTLTSSIQVFNLMYNIQGNNLEVLEMFADYGRQAFNGNNDKPFQKLLFLIRDWPYPYEYPYGVEGGQKFIEKTLAINEKLPIELQRIRRNIRSFFSQINCFLMPNIGGNVKNADFDGRLADIDTEFTEQLRLLVPLILEPKNLVVKEIDGRQVTGSDLLEYFKMYTNEFVGQTLPEPKPMPKEIGGDRCFMNRKTINNYNLRDQTFDMLDKNPKVCGRESKKKKKKFSAKRILPILTRLNTNFQFIGDALSNTRFSSSIGKRLAANKKSQ